ETLDRRTGLDRRAKLAPRALRRFLVRPKPQELGPVAEPPALHLVVAHLDDDLRPHGRLLELAAAPAVRLREAALGRVLEEGQDDVRDLVVPRGRDCGRADVVEVAVVAPEAEQERGDPPLAIPFPA